MSQEQDLQRSLRALGIAICMATPELRHLVPVPHQRAICAAYPAVAGEIGTVQWLTAALDWMADGIEIMPGVGPLLAASAALAGAVSGGGHELTVDLSDHLDFMCGWLVRRGVDPKSLGVPQCSN